MATPDIYSLIMANDEPTAQEKAQMMAQTLRGQDALGSLALFGQNSGTKDFGRAQVSQVKNREDQLADAGKYRLQMSMEREKAKAKGKGDALNYTQELRKELMGNQVVKNTQLIGEGFAKMKGAFGSPGPTSDIGMVFGLMKMLDPTSTVREGEQAQAREAAGVPAQVLNLYNRIVKGEKLPPETRKDFMKQAGILMQAQMSRYKPLAVEFGRLADQAGVARNDVVLDLGFEDPGAGPAVREPAPPAPVRRADPESGEIREWNGRDWVPVRE